jgi:hypothetical protein
MSQTALRRHSEAFQFQYRSIDQAAKLSLPAPTAAHDLGEKNVELDRSAVANFRLGLPS